MFIVHTNVNNNKRRALGVKGEVCVHGFRDWKGRGLVLDLTCH